MEASKPKLVNPDDVLNLIVFFLRVHLLRFGGLRIMKFYGMKTRLSVSIEFISNLKKTNTNHFIKYRTIIFQLLFVFTIIYCSKKSQLCIVIFQMYLLYNQHLILGIFCFKCNNNAYNMRIAAFVPMISELKYKLTKLK